MMFYCATNVKNMDCRMCFVIAYYYAHFDMVLMLTINVTKVGLLLRAYESPVDKLLPVYKTEAVPGRIYQKEAITEALAINKNR